jgi:hypothetical protein
LNWSPEQVSEWLKRHGKEYVRYETIYKHIWNEKKRGGTLFRYLRHSGKKYNKRSKGTAGRGCIPGRVDIKERPKIAEQKIRLEDWELDTTLFLSGGIKGNSISENIFKTIKILYSSGGNSNISWSFQSNDFLNTEKDNSKSLALDTRCGKISNYDPLKDNPRSFRKLSLEDIFWAKQSFEQTPDLKLIYPRITTES